MGISAVAAPVNRSFWNASTLKVPGVGPAVSAAAVIVLARSSIGDLGLPARDADSGAIFAIGGE
ncbi:MAG: hypothetical protein DME05_26725 [Candidatus Rokuibacteriota bacterium]|nr:MAG: hypothetical protein DME05_26725 [Candidatus Rokubacteria bacterium]